MTPMYLIDALAGCNGCDAEDAIPGEPGGYGPICLALCSPDDPRDAEPLTATCAYCGGERGPVVEGTGYEACCAACREDGGPAAGRDYFGRDDLGPEGFSE